MEGNCELPNLNSNNTPKRTIVRRHCETPLQRFQKENCESDNKSTPISFNPFEVKADSLYFPSCSPSVFATFAKNKTNNGTFRWSIDHVSILYPADIDETSNPDDKLDPEQEIKIQEAIDSYFSQNSIVPSPWSSDSKPKGRRQLKFRKSFRDSQNSTSFNDASTQTILTVPPQVDLLAVLGSKYLYNGEDGCESSLSSSSNSNNSSYREADVLSNSSLRRKLFVAEECKTPKLERKDLILAKQWTTPKLSTHSMQSTPSDLLSSSPITPPNCNESCIVFSPIPLSPIAVLKKGSEGQSFIERLEDVEESKKEVLYECMASDSQMSFCVDSQDNGTFPSYGSERQDTGYVTGNTFSMQNLTSEVGSGFPRVAPFSEESEDCGMSISVMSCSDGPLPGHFFSNKEVQQTFFRPDKFPLTTPMPINCSTPTFNL